MMSATFSDLVQIYRKTELINGSALRAFYIQTEEQLNILNQLLSDENYNNTALSTKNELKLGSTVNLNFGTPKPQFGRFCDTLDDLIKSDFAQFNNPALFQAPFFIVSDNISFDENVPIIKSYQLVKDFLQQLIKICSHINVLNRKLIFYSSKTFELSIDVGDKLSEFAQSIRELNDDECKKIKELQNWFNDEITKNHFSEKKSILIYVLHNRFSSKDELSETKFAEANFFDVIKNIEKISKEVYVQYGLYLENFSYEKFIDKLGKNTDAFINKINDTTSKVQLQFLGLPFLTAVPSALKSWDNCFIYLALILYCVIYGLALYNQKFILDNIKQDVEDFENKGKIPEDLRNEWEKNKNRINKSLSNQLCLYKVLCISLIPFLFYGVWKLISIWHIYDLIINFLI